MADVELNSSSSVNVPTKDVTANSSVDDSSRDETTTAAQQGGGGGDDSTAVVPPTTEAAVTGFGTKKKKKSSTKKKDGETSGSGGAATSSSIIDGTGEIFKAGRIYPYEELLDRVQALIMNHNPDLQGSKKYILKPPQVSRVGTRRIAWTNFKELCQQMRRSPEHVFQFVVAELGTDGSITGDGQLVVKGRYTSKHAESLLRKYITEYVTCSMCKSPQTTLERDNRTRLFNICCSSCGANRSVATIKSGFHAETRAERIKAKMAK